MTKIEVLKIDKNVLFNFAATSSTRGHDSKIVKSILLSMLVTFFILVTELLITGMHSVVRKDKLVQLLLLRRV